MRSFSRDEAQEDDPDGDGWEAEMMRQSEGVDAHTSTLAQLPAVHPTSPTLPFSGHHPEAPWISGRRSQTTGYDWASFAYAYSRGKWDPASIPRPPGRSNVVPGMETRISSEQIKPSTHAETDTITELVAQRRPSIDYHDLSMSPSETASKVLYGDEVDVHSRLEDYAWSEARKGLEKQANGDEAPSSTSPGKRSSAVTELETEQDASSEQRPHFTTSTVGRQRRRSSQKESDIFEHFSPYDLLAKATSSAPAMGEAIVAAKAAQDQISRFKESELRDQGTSSSGGAKSDPEPVTRKTLRTERQGSLEWPSTTWDKRAWSFADMGANPSSADATSASSSCQIYNATSAAHLSSRPTLRSLSHEGNGSQQSMVRPEPIPLQSSELAQARTSRTNSQDDQSRAENDKALASDAGEDIPKGPTLAYQNAKRDGKRPMAAQPSVQRDNIAQYVEDGLTSPRRVSLSDLASSDPLGHNSVLPPLSGSLTHGWNVSKNPNLASYLNVGQQIEDFYRRYGYLPAIAPPDEFHRRQVLRRYGPSRTQTSANFERIAHLVKLVFNTKFVYVNLVGSEQTDIAASSIGSQCDKIEKLGPIEALRTRECSMCAHAILQPSDEPLVVLDAQKDWRFAGNPLVRGTPNIRFYAGCPLRTSDGNNLGSLCLVDDKPWKEFTPRQRHTLKEFSRVVMRELELIRDTIHLRVRDRMQHSIEFFTRKCVEMDSSEGEEGPGLQDIYDSAAECMREALKASGTVIFDMSQYEAVVTANPDGTEAADGNGRIFLPNPYQFPEMAPLFAQAQQGGLRNGTEQGSSSHEPFADLKNKSMPSLPVLGASLEHDRLPAQEQHFPLSHHVKIAKLLQNHREGRYYGFLAGPFRDLLPPRVSNLLVVPIFGLNRQPFALLCAFSRPSEGEVTLEDIKDAGLQYLRAMGTIILSAVLKKDIMLADQAKSHFISNISHELRTPLHGILAAAELLTETKLNATQASYLDTVEACGKSLLELVNHVLDFTKLSGNSLSKQPAAKPTQRCDLVKLIQEVCESSWIGQMAKNLDSARHAGIGSAYAKGSEASSPSTAGSANIGTKLKTLSLSSDVETVIDIAMRPTGWFVKCDAGGIRRVLMNLIGNSLKFTSGGFVHVALREVQTTDTHVIIELSVTDTGKGISRAFLEQQLFHPFTQENHLGPGTGLGLSIVNSIVQSPAVNGKIDVWSTLGQGTEIRVTCDLELCPDSEAEGPIYKPYLNVRHERSIAFRGFSASSRGASDLKDVMRTYFEDWWRFNVKLISDEDEDDDFDLVLVNEDFSVLAELAQREIALLPPVILLSALRGNVEMNAACDSYQSKGGVVRTLFKPTGPAKLEAVTDFCLQCFERGQVGEPMLLKDSEYTTPLPSPASEKPPYAKETSEATRFLIDTTPTADDDAITPKGPEPTHHSKDVQRPSALPEPVRPPLRPTLSNELRRKTHHISPGPLSISDTAVLRRHSSEGQSDDVSLVRRVSVTEDGDRVAETVGFSSVGKTRRSRPLLPARSITYHEPNLQRHVLLSPLRSPHQWREGGEAYDYFGPIATAASSTSGRNTLPRSNVSSPSTPGSVISLDGGEGAVLKTAIHTAGIVRPLHGPVAKKKRLQILSVEDNNINRRVLAAFFGKMDVDFVEATNGEEGVRAFESYPPFHFDVVFMDLSMPVLDGIGATRQIRKIEAERFRAEQANTLAWTRDNRPQIPIALSSSSSAASHSTSATSSTSSGSGTEREKATSAQQQTKEPHPPQQVLLHTPGGSRPSHQARAKIFALTGRSSDDDKRRAFSSGADGFIVKPLSFKVLSSLLNSVSAYR